ncbi:MULTISPECIES: NirD/YgiW/YdeI family stress tolerance protein [Pseudomonas]|uniref:NirD/YgiW/YdeI family stress tolerance protein n=1 Tax=Pseudomonas TaxID=286 RepID=UPI000D6EBA77|nr:NirD/YgiW/YdeI family stress tolerance protein [Pseudomonas sp. RW407]PWU28464.1 stress-induced protein YgiW [Pseudomonas sp. RW407]
MKSIRLPLIAAIALFSGATFAAGGYTGPGSDAAKPAASGPVNTVKAAQAAADDTPAVLEGVITKRLHGEHYEFKDATGSMQVEIDHDDWPQGVDISDKTKVRLTGEVDHERKGVEIDVDRVDVLQ